MGYIKRTPLSEFRAQNRGGVGSKGTDTRDADFIEHIYQNTEMNVVLKLFTHPKNSIRKISMQMTK